MLHHETHDNQVCTSSTLKARRSVSIEAKPKKSNEVHHSNTVRYPYEQNNASCRESDCTYSKGVRIMGMKMRKHNNERMRRSNCNMKAAEGSAGCTRS